MTHPKVSVIVPIYNVEKYLDECMVSLLNQTLKDIEIILVDDESPDNCPKMCDEYANKDKRVKVIHKKNCGLGFARNSGLDVATGEYVAFIDSDDFIDLNMMEHLYNVATEHNADEVRCGIKFYVDGKFTERHDVDKLTVFRGKEQVLDFMLDVVGPLPECKRDVKYMMSSCCCIHSRKVIEDNSIRFLSERECLSEDLIWDIDFFSKMNCVVYVPECHYAYRMNPSSLSHHFSWKKYRRQDTFFNAIKERLDALYSQKEYSIHLLRLKFLYMRNYISEAFSINEGLGKRRKLVRTMLQDDIWHDLFTEYPYSRLPKAKRIYFFLAKHQMIFFLFIISKMMKYREKLKTQKQ